jgi:hypothetical protein
MNPMVMSAIGFLTSIYALLAHDARTLDLNSHIKHHHYRTCNYALYWGFWDYVFGTRYSKKKYPVDYIPSWILDQKKNGVHLNGNKEISNHSINGSNGSNVSNGSNGSHGTNGSSKIDDKSQ